MTEATPAPESASVPEQTTETAPEPRTFTQDELDAIVQQRLARERSKLGDVEELRAKAARLEELEASQLTELERLQKRAAEAEAARDAALQRAQATAVRAEVITAATQAGALDPEVVMALLPEGSVTVADDGTVTGVQDAVKALLKAKPYLAATPAAPVGTADGGPRGSAAPAQLTREQLARLSPSEIEQARLEGRLDSLLGRS
jgi:serine/threonine protein kinase HipA of HipAB toxin-antitoxin module